MVIPSWVVSREPSEALLASVRAAHDRGAGWSGSASRSFVIAAAGLVDGREVATHWSAAPELARRRPSATVRSDVLWCRPRRRRHLRRGRGRPRLLPARRAHRPRRRVRRRRGPSARAGTPPGRQPGAVHPRPVLPHPVGGPGRGRDGLGDRAARDTAGPGHLGAERAPVAADVHPPVPCPTPAEPVAVAPAPAPGAGPRAAGVDGRARRAGGRHGRPRLVRRTASALRARVPHQPATAPAAFRTSP